MQSNSTNLPPQSDSRIAVFSNTSFGTVLLDILAGQKIIPTVIITVPDKPAGRGSRLRQTPIKSWATRRGIRMLEPAALADEKFLGAVRSIKPDVFIVASFGRMLPPPLLAIPPEGTLNIHPSLIPAYRGPAPIQAAILNGDKETGVTIMFTDDKMDHGPILAQQHYALHNPRITAPELEKELAAVGARMILDILPKLQSGKIRPTEQNHAMATYTKLITKEDGAIHWTEDAAFIERKIRAYQPWPGAYAFWQKSAKKKLRLIFYQAEVIALPERHMRNGNVFAADGSFAVATPRGALCITAIKPEGGKTMSGAEFLRGHPDIVGSILL